MKYSRIHCHGSLALLVFARRLTKLGEYPLGCDLASAIVGPCRQLELCRIGVEAVESSRKQVCKIRKQ